MKEKNVEQQQSTGTKENILEELDVQNDHEKLNQQYAEIKDTLQRVYAEFQNYKKRTEEDKTRFIKMSTEELIKKILPIMDNFELALEHNKQENDFSKGIEMIYAQLKEVLQDEGIEEINARGQFNPELHEALLTEESNKAQGTILEQLQKGYKIGGRVIRHAKVKISKKANNQGGN
ncbi:MAG: nucleotide exchange factor GrpE [Candidatus Levybacteria bacterium CG10_big_fil_rev_8_21_14_0_10_35_13]|nr:MAG: nucleotide exchange factor GrpE [Candidatus Levybacteria bacterium CG10_big_fil_rev_8_21_14_0_10_35_13]